uniref:EF-hand domain-containing protein n=1 Tax=Noctiluca scintillans TaxID=2966 RepID=A0A7S1FKU2_NOCSC|mmetsp:Transcript_9505/g.26586  ORF Transcript_9505/g.26586 Transcript_9505/m.26586 type:complete len:669 (+) Transcript_9505:72-2078(+)
MDLGTTTEVNLVMLGEDTGALGDGEVILESALRDKDLPLSIPLSSNDIFLHALPLVMEKQDSLHAQKTTLLHILNESLGSLSNLVEAHAEEQKTQQAKLRRCLDCSKLKLSDAVRGLGGVGSELGHVVPPTPATNSLSESRISALPAEFSPKCSVMPQSHGDQVGPIVIGRSSRKSRVIFGTRAQNRASSRERLSEIGGKHDKRNRGTVDSHTSDWVRRAYRTSLMKLKVDLRNSGSNRSLWMQICSSCSGVSRSISRRRCNFTRLGVLVRRPWYQCAISMLVVLNCVAIGQVSDYTVQAVLRNHYEGTSNEQRPIHMDIMDAFFVIAFAMELTLRVLASEGEFLVGPQWRWNMFDTLITLSSGVELAFTHAPINFTYLRVVRVTTLFRSFRVFHFFRLAPFIRSLRLMLLAISTSLVPFIWAVCILLILVFISSVIFVNGVAEYVRDAEVGDSLVDDMQAFFGSMPMSLLSLFMTISGGVDWWEVGFLLSKISTVYLLTFLCFLSVSMLAVMNVITGIFVKEALESAEKDRDLQLQLELEENRYLLLKLHSFFQDMDASDTGRVTLQQFEGYLAIDDVRILFQQIGLEVSDAVSFFKILDVDGSEELSIEEFVMGCMRFKGKASRLDFEVALLESKRIMVRLGKAQEVFLEWLRRIDNNVCVLLQTQ